MVYIVKKKKGELVDGVIKRTAALMINMEYGLEIYKICNGHIIKNVDTTKKFNTIDYEFFTDTYIFNCGAVIVLLPHNMQSGQDPMYNKIKDVLFTYVTSLDVFSDAENKKAVTLTDEFKSTRYTTIWEKRVERDNRMLIWNENNDPRHNFSKDKSKYTRFIWNICPSSSLEHYLNNNIKQDIFRRYRSLSTIIVDLLDWIKCDENMQIIPDDQLLIKNNNVPLPKQLWYKEKKILLTPIQVSERYGIDIEIQKSTVLLSLYNGHVSFLGHLKIFFQPYSELNLTPVNKRLNLIQVINLKDAEPSEKDVNDNVNEITKYNICNDCLTPLFDEFYVIEKNDTRAQFAFCKICLHTNEIHKRNEANITLLKSKIPRTREHIIDIMKKPEGVDLDDFPFYKAILKLIHKKFPKEIDYSAKLNKAIIHIPITDEIVLILNMPNFWKYTEYFQKTKYKAIIPIELTV